MGFRAALALAGALAWGSCSEGALAQGADAGTRVAARELAIAGAEAYDGKEYATALDRFRRAEQLYKVPSITVMLARCLAHQGRLVEAMDKYEETLRMPVDAAAPEAFRRAVIEAAAEVETMRLRVPRLELQLPADAPRGTEVLLDDRLVPAALIGVATPVDPGSHRVAARAPGKAPFLLELSLEEGGHRVVPISLPAAKPVADPSPGAEVASGRGPSALSIVLLAGGGLALAFGTVTGIAALNHKAALDDGCSPGCPPQLRDDLDSYRSNRTLSYVGLGVGLAAVGAGTFLLFHRGASTQVGAVVYPGGALLTGRF